MDGGVPVVGAPGSEAPVNGAPMDGAPCGFGAAPPPAGTDGWIGTPTNGIGSMGGGSPALARVGEVGSESASPGAVGSGGGAKMSGGSSPFNGAARRRLRMKRPMPTTTSPRAGQKIHGVVRG